MINRFKKKVEKFLLDESGSAPKKGIISAGLLAFALSALSVKAYDERYQTYRGERFGCGDNGASDVRMYMHPDSCWGKTSDGKLSFKLFGCHHAGLWNHASWVRSNSNFPLFVPKSVLQELGFLGDFSDDYLLISEKTTTELIGSESTTYTETYYTGENWIFPERMISSHISRSVCFASDHFNTSGTVDIDYEAVYHKNELGLEHDIGSQSLVASHLHDIEQVDVPEIDWKVSDHFNAGFGCVDNLRDAVADDDVTTEWVCEEDDDCWRSGDEYEEDCDQF
jgi:hypothetical protein